MLISHKNKFVFVRVSKNGSSSAQAMLAGSGILGPGDIVSGCKDDPRSGFVTEPRNVPDFGIDELEKVSEYPFPPLRSQGLPASGAHAFVGHLTPKEMVGLGLLTEEQLFSYKLFGFVREPVDRWLSGYFFANSLMGWVENESEQLSNICSRIRSGNLDLGVFFNRPQKGWFYYEGERVGSAYDYGNMTERLTSIILEMSGTTETEPRLKSKYRPEEFRRPVESWLPSDCQKILKDYLAEDIDFYHEVASENFNRRAS